MTNEVMIYEVHLGHDLFFDQATLAADGWYWNWGHGTPEDLQGPFPDPNAASDAATQAADDETELHIIDVRGLAS
jgi:hypothetical protein